MVHMESCTGQASHSAHQFDEESLIRIFVRVRHEGMDSKQRQINSAIYSKVLADTQYRLPIVAAAHDKDALLQRIIGDIKSAEERIILDLMIQDRVMQVKKTVVAPTTIVYIDAVTHLMISYDEYEQRYVKYLQAKKAFPMEVLVSQVLEMPSKRLHTPTIGQSPVISVARCTKRRKLQEVQ